MVRQAGLEPRRGERSHAVSGEPAMGVPAKEPGRELAREGAGR